MDTPCHVTNRYRKSYDFLFTISSEKKYGIEAGAHGYDSLLLLISCGEAAALDRFFQELAEHLAIHRDQACDPAQWPYRPVVDQGDGVRKMSLSDTLASAERGPAMLLGSRSITLLHAFLLGLAEGHRDAGRDIGDLTKLDAFECWLNAREKLRTWCRWDRILLYRSGNREGDAVTKFLEEFRLFEQHGGFCCTAVASEKRMR